MVARDVTESNDCGSTEDIAAQNGEDLSSRITKNAEIRIPEFRQQLLDVKETMSSAAEMYHQDYLDKVEDREDLTKEARDKAVTCLVDVSKKIYDLADCFQQLIEDQALKLQEIENLTITATASLETNSCFNFRNELHNKLPPANIPNRQPRIGRPETLQTNFYNENIIWEKLNYNKYDGVGLTCVPQFNEEHYAKPVIGGQDLVTSTSQQSLDSVNSSTRGSQVNSTQSPSLQNQNSLRVQNSRLSISNVDVSRNPSSPALNRYGSSTSLASINSTKSDLTSKSTTGVSTLKTVVNVKRTLSSLQIKPARSAPAPPPAKQNPSRARVYSVKNQTGEGLDKPTIPAPRPPLMEEEEEEHYATPPASRMATVDEEKDRGGEVSHYQEVKIRSPPVSVVPPPPAAPPPAQYQTIAVAPTDYVDDDEIYSDMADDMYLDMSSQQEETYLDMSPASASPAPASPALKHDALFGPKNPISVGYNTSYKRQESVPILSVIPPPPPGEDTDSEFEDREEDDEIYTDVDNIYDAPSLVPRPSGRDSAASDHTVTGDPPLPCPPQEDEELYTENDVLPPPPADILPPPPPPDDDIYTDMGVMPDMDDNIYTDNVIDHADIAVNAHIVSVSKDSGFYTEDPDDEDHVIERVRVIYPYSATASDELNLCVGDIVAVHVKNPDGWFEGTLNGVRGLFPGNYSEPAE